MHPHAGGMSNVFISYGNEGVTRSVPYAVRCDLARNCSIGGDEKHGRTDSNDTRDEGEIIEARISFGHH